MEFALFVWLTGVIPTLKGFLLIPVACILIYCAGKIIWAMYSSDSYTEKYSPSSYQKAAEVWKFKWLKWPATWVVALSVTASLLPTEKTMYMMAAAYGSQQLVQSEAAEKVVKIVNGKLDEYLQEIEQKAKK